MPKQNASIWVNGTRYKAVSIQQLSQPKEPRGPSERKAVAPFKSDVKASKTVGWI